MCGLARGPAERDAEVVLVVDDLVAWLVALFADAGRRRLTTWVMGSDQERVLHRAGMSAVESTVGELCPDDSARAEGLSKVINQVFRAPALEPLLAACTTMLEGLQAGIAGQLAVLDDPAFASTPESSAELLGFSGAALAEKLTGHLVREIVARGARGGPLEPLASQLNHDATHLRLEQVKNELAQLAAVVRDLPARLDTGHAAAASPVPRGAEMFDELLAEPVVGREWLAAEIDAFCDQQDRGYFVIEGDAGMGKTTFAAWLARERDYPAHFAQLDPDAATAAGAVRAIGAKLIADWDLTELGRGWPTERSSSSWLRSVLSAAARRRDEVAPDTPIVVVVDALDADIEPPDHHLPLGLPDRLPTRVYVVATVRTGGLRYVPERCATRGLDGALSENVADLRQYLVLAARERYLTDAMARAGLSPDRFADLLLERSAGIWIYVRYVLEEIKRDPRTVSALPDLPRGLEEYYNNNLGRLCNGPEGTSLHILVLASLAVAAEPVDAPTLAAFAGIGDWLRAELLLDGMLRPYCVVMRMPGESRRRFKIRHPSLTEYLTGSVPAADSAETGACDRPANVSSLRTVLAEACRDTCNRICDRYLAAWGGMDRQVPDLEAAPELGGMDGGYALRWLATHLLAAGRAEDLHYLLACGPQKRNTWFEAHDRLGDVTGYLHDVERARGSARRLGMQLRYALIEASMASISTTLPPRLIGALVTRGLWEPSLGFSHVERITDEKRQTQALAQIADKLDEQLLGRALSLAMRCRDDENRAAALNAVIGVPHPPGDLLELAADAMFSTEYSTWGGRAPIEYSPDSYLAPMVAVGMKLPANRRKELRMRHIHVLNQARYGRAALALFGDGDHFERARRALSCAPQVDNEYQRGLLVATLIPHLHLAPDVFNQVFTVLGTMSYLDAPLLALAEHAPPERLEEVLEFAARKWHPIAGFFERAGPRLTSELLPAALRLCQAVQRSDQKAVAFAAIAPLLNADQAQEFLAPGDDHTFSRPLIFEVLKLYDERSELIVISALLDRLPRHEACKRASEYISWTRMSSRSERLGLPLFARYLQPDRRRTALTLINHGLKWPGDGPEQHAALLPRFWRLSNEEISDAFDSAAANSWSDARFVVTEVLAPFLSDQLLLTLARSRALPLEEECFSALARLGQLQPEAKRGETALRGLIMAAGISQARYKSYAVAALAPILLHPELSAAAFEILRLADPFWGVRAIERMADVMPLEGLPKVPESIRDWISPDPRLDIPRILERLSADGRTDVIDRLLPQQDTSWEPARWEEALSGLAPVLSPAQARRLWATWDRENSGPHDAVALSVLAGRLPERERAAAVDEVLATCTPMSGSDREEEQALAWLARAASTERLTTALAELLNRERKVREWVLKEIAPILPESMIEAALQYALSDDDDLTCKSLAQLAPRLSGARLNRAIAHVSRMKYQPWTVAALVPLAQQLPREHEDRETVLARALDAALFAPSQSKLQGAMVRLIPQLPEPLRPRAVSAVADEVCSDLRWHRQPSGEQFDRLRAVLTVLRGPELERLYVRLGEEVQNPRVRAHAQAAVIQAGGEHAEGFLGDGQSLHQNWPGDFDRAGIMDLTGAAAWWINETSRGADVDEVVEAIFDVTRWWP